MPCLASGWHQMNINSLLPLPYQRPPSPFYPLMSVGKVIAMFTGHFSSLVHDPECSEKDVKERIHVQDRKKPQMSHIFILIQFTGCSARKLESIANQAQFVLMLASWICSLSCNNVLDTVRLAWSRGSTRCRDTKRASSLQCDKGTLS